MSEGATSTELAIITPPTPEAAEPSNGFERFIALLKLPTPAEQTEIQLRLDQTKKELARWQKAPVAERGPQPLLPRHLVDGEDPETRELAIKEANFTLKEIGPQVLSNIGRILDAYPAIDGTNGSPEFFEKRTADLKQLLSFEFVPQGRAMTPREQRQLRYALALVSYMTNKHVSGDRAWGGLYEVGMDKLTYQLRENPAYTHSAEAQQPEVVKMLGRQSLMVARAISVSFGIGAAEIPNRGMIDGSGNRDAGYESLTFYARRVDPEYYEDLEDRMMGLNPEQPKVAAPSPQPSTLPS